MRKLGILLLVVIGMLLLSCEKEEFVNDYIDEIVNNDTIIEDDVVDEVEDEIDILWNIIDTLNVGRYCRLDTAPNGNVSKRVSVNDIINNVLFTYRSEIGYTFIYDSTIIRRFNLYFVRLFDINNKTLYFNLKSVTYLSDLLYSGGEYINIIKLIGNNNNLRINKRKVIVELDSFGYLSVISDDYINDFQYDETIRLCMYNVEGIKLDDEFYQFNKYQIRIINKITKYIYNDIY